VIDPDLFFVVLASSILLWLVQTLGSSRWVKLSSDASYALYLLHFPMVSLMVQAARAAGPAERRLLALR
jgi:peptidoglycan/LPS O-acetylase OafA/YrhL